VSNSGKMTGSVHVAETGLRQTRLAIALCTGVGFLAYLAAWIVIPVDTRFEMEAVMAD